MNLSKNVKIVQASTVTAGAAGTSDITTAIIDMQGFEGVQFIVPFGAIVSGAATSIKVQQGQAANMSDAADLAGTAQTIADTDDDKTFYTDIYRPGERYIQLVVDRGTQNATVGAIIALLYEAKTRPVTHGTSVSGETHISPAEGTA